MCGIRKELQMNSKNIILINGFELKLLAGALHRYQASSFNWITGVGLKLSVPLNG